MLAIKKYISIRNKATNGLNEKILTENYHSNELIVAQKDKINLTNICFIYPMEYLL